MLLALRGRRERRKEETRDTGTIIPEESKNEEARGQGRDTVMLFQNGTDDAQEEERREGKKSATGETQGNEGVKRWV